MPKKTVKKNKGQNTKDNRQTDIENDSIQTPTPVISTPPTSSVTERTRKPVDKKSKPSKPELELSKTRRSPRPRYQRSNLIPKAPLPLARSPVAKSYPRPVESEPFSSLSPSLSIMTRKTPDQQSTRSPSKPASSYYTALSSPMSSQDESSGSSKSIVRVDEQKAIKEPAISHPSFEIPSSMPWENTPSEGYGDAWPSSQSESGIVVISQEKNVNQLGSGSYMPSIPSCTVDVGDARRPVSASSVLSVSTGLDDGRTNDGFRIPDLPLRSSSKLDDTQDLTQDEESELDLSMPGRKRKRVATVNEIQESSPPSVQQYQREIHTVNRTEEDSCVLLSQAPPHMRKRTPEIITIHSSESQSQNFIPLSPKPGPKSTSLPQSPASAHSSQTSSVGQYPHNWGSSQPTQPPLDNLPDFQSTEPPPQSPIVGHGKPSKIPEPLGMTLEYGFPKKRDYENLPDLDELEQQKEAQLQRWEAQTRRKSKSK